jgi:hypothetical protein
MNVMDTLAVVLIALAIANVGSTTILVLAAARHRWPALEERATVAVVLAVIAAGAATLGLVRLRILDLSSEASVAVLAVGLVLVSVPSIVWLAAFLTGRFEESEAVTSARAEDAAATGNGYDGRGDH